MKRDFFVAECDTPADPIRLGVDALSDTHLAISDGECALSALPAIRLGRVKRSRQLGVWAIDDKILAWLEDLC